jgi:hypothetical protein
MAFFLVATSMALWVAATVIGVGLVAFGRWL